MNPIMEEALANGYHCLLAWTDLLDRINVFPVADGDTGLNLKISLAPLQNPNGHGPHTASRLLDAATGNSGNIAAAFLSGLLSARDLSELPDAARQGRQKAEQAVCRPQRGTMLSVFESLDRLLPGSGLELSEKVPKITEGLAATVRETADMLPALKSAGVVDAGALGMFIFLTGFLNAIAGDHASPVAVNTLFSGKLRVKKDYRNEPAQGHCLDMVIRMKSASQNYRSVLSEIGESLIVTADAANVKVHLHSADKQLVKERVSALGEIVKWSEDPLVVHRPPEAMETDREGIHIMTDAAGSVTRQDAQALEMTLLDSYILSDDRSTPETTLPCEGLYSDMRRGIRFKTAQASLSERHHAYKGALSRYHRVLYLCVGSVYTGNYEVAARWKKTNDPEDRFVVIDTGAASGKLGIVALAAARFAKTQKSAEKVVRFAENAVRNAREYVFLDRLRYLAAGGRVSKTSGFFGDLLHFKPIISPTAEGVKKIGVVRSRKDQMAFALQRLTSDTLSDPSPFVLLQYTDNRKWVEQVLRPRIVDVRPAAETIVQPLSLTSGVHMGPGTWAMALLPGANPP